MIVYFLTCATVDFYASLLPGLAAAKGLPLRALHGRMKQAAREETLAAFAEMPAGDYNPISPPPPPPIPSCETLASS